MKFLSNRSTKPASKSAFNAACAAMACCIVASAATAEPFTYQGQLTDNNQPANGLYDMTFRLTDAAVGGFALAVDSVANVSVVDGLFTVEIDFPSSQLNSSNRWMSITVDGAILSPRVRLRETPRALNAVRANTAGTLDTPVIMIDSSSAGIVTAENTSTAQNASGLLGRITSTSPGGVSAGVRGENNGTGFSGVGVYGIHNGFGYGVYGTSPGGLGVFGNSDAGFGLWGQSDVNTGVYARTNSGPQALEALNSDADTEAFLATEDYGLLALNIETPNFGTGIRGEGGRVGVQGISQVDTQSGAQFGVWGQAGGRDINPRDVFGVYGSGQGSEIVGGRRVYGVYGVAGSGVQGNFAYGVYGTTTGPGEKGNNRFAGYFDGDVHVTGNLSKASGSFKIDHPLDPENKYLSHSFVESPDMMNIYNGVITLSPDGEGVIQLPDYFETLNRDFRYQLTAMGTPMPNLYVSEEVSANQFSIAGGVAGARVSWEITGIRQDPSAITNPIVVEQDKPEQHKGKYLDPEAFGLGNDHAIHPKPVQN
tara:strand:- start:57535 stop:59148 length:1614 start_codon:yes stop_codon:yes gene_type:complete